MDKISVRLRKNRLVDLDFEKINAKFGYVTVGKPHAYY